MNNKSLSPLLSGIILIAITISAAFITATTFSSVIQKQSQSKETQELSSCSVASLQILNTFYKQNTTYLYPNWWNTSFPYRKEITINNSINNNNLTDYQIPINISYSTNMQPDFDDLRFTWYNSSSGKEQKLPYWIENYSSSHWAYIWIKIPYIPANTTDTGYGKGIQKIYMYYGNSLVTNESNGTLTFEFFDDFEDQSYSDRWSYDYSSGCCNSFADITTGYKQNYAFWIHDTDTLELVCTAGVQILSFPLEIILSLH